MCEGGACLPSLSVAISKLDGKSFVAIGPLQPLAGYALSNFFNREFYNLDPRWSDLYIAQGRQKHVTRENSFVVEDGGEVVWMRADTPDEIKKVERFINARRSDIEFVIANPDIDPHLRYQSFQDAKRSYLMPKETSLALQ